MWKKCGIARQATDDNIICRMRTACWMIKATVTLRIILFFLQQNTSSYANAPQCYLYTYIACPVKICSS